MLHLAAAVANAKATGINRYVGGLAGIGVAGGRVLLIDAENGEAVLHRRVQTCGLETEAAEHFHVVDAFGWDVADPAQLAGARGDGARARDRPVHHRRLPGRLARAGDRELGGRRGARPAAAPVPHLGRRRRAPAPRAQGERRERRQLPRRDRRRRRGGEHRRDRAGCPATPTRGGAGSRTRRCRFAVEADTRWIRLGEDDGDHVEIETAEPMLAAGAPRRAEVAEQLLDVLLRVAPQRRRAETTAADLTRALGLDPPNGTVRRALTELEYGGYVVQGEKGWSSTPAARTYHRNGAMA